MSDESFRALTAKEIRKQKNVRRCSEEKQHEKRRRSDDDEGRSGSDDVARRKCRENDRLSDRKYGREKRERSMERHGDSHRRDEKRYSRGRAEDLGERNKERNSGLGFSRDRSRDRYSSKEKEDRTDYRDHHHNESDSKEHRNDRRSYGGTRNSRRSHSSRHYSPEDVNEESGDRPAWATKAVMKRAEEIQKRKLIWSKPEEKKESEGKAGSSPEGPRPSTTATWNSILAASSSDSKQLDKFKRLMGMKKSDEEGQEEVPRVDDSQVEAERKRQRELYSHLDQQYAVARSFTHLSRGQGLGFHQ